MRSIAYVHFVGGICHKASTFHVALECWDMCTWCPSLSK